jgi:hypothetical protein
MPINTVRLAGQGAGLQNRMTTAAFMVTNNVAAWNYVTTGLAASRTLEEIRDFTHADGGWELFLGGFTPTTRPPRFGTLSGTVQTWNASEFIDGRHVRGRYVILVGRPPAPGDNNSIQLNHIAYSFE